MRISQAIITKYHGATNPRGARVSATAGGGARVMIPFDSRGGHEESHIKAAQALCDELGWSGKRHVGGLKDGYVHVFAN